MKTFFVNSGNILCLKNTWFKVYYNVKSLEKYDELFTVTVKSLLRVISWVCLLVWPLLCSFNLKCEKLVEFFVSFLKKDRKWLDRANFKKRNFLKGPFFKVLNSTKHMSPEKCLDWEISEFYSFNFRVLVSTGLQML